jgi:hypothetical protein
MKDAENNELIIGQRVVVSVGYGLRKATLVQVKPCNSRYVKYLRDNVGASRWATQERLEQYENYYRVRLDNGEVKRIGNKKAILAL